MTCRSLPAALFPGEGGGGGAFFTWLEAHLPRDQNTDTVMVLSQCVFVSRSPRWDEYRFYNKTLEVCNCPVTWHGEIAASALCGSSWPRGTSVPRDKHRFTSARDHISAPNCLLPKLDVSSKYQRSCESFKSLGTAVAHYLISSILYFLFEHEGTNAWHALILLFSSVLVGPSFPPNLQNACVFLASMNLAVLLKMNIHLHFLKCSLFICCYKGRAYLILLRGKIP